MDLFNCTTSPLASLLESTQSSGAKTEVSRCAACECIRVISKMQKSELRLIKYGPALSGTGTFGKNLNVSHSDDSGSDQDSCCCICHLDDGPGSGSISPVSDCLHQVNDVASRNRHSHAISAAQKCCKCYAMCINFIHKVRTFVIIA